MSAPIITSPSCRACGAALTGGTRFCIHCGTPAGETSVAPDAFGRLTCPACGGDGSGLPSGAVYCSTCRWLRPLGPGYELPVESFIWRFDADAIRTLRSIAPLNAMAEAVSERVGRPWLEASVNGLRLSERQLPDIFSLAIRAARIVGLRYLPEIYISGEQMWEAMTLGTDATAFVVLGSVLTNFKGDDLLFLLAREMGHCRAGHAMWRTVAQFLSGRTHKASIMGEGVLGLLNPVKLVESAMDAPLLAWSRHAEITADRAGLLAVGSEAVARRALLTWTLKSFPLQQRINLDAWMEQEAAAGDDFSRLAEWTLSGTPYLASRLRVVREFARSDEVRAWRALIEHWAPALPPQPSQAEQPPARPTPTAPDAEMVRLVCLRCREPMRVPRSALAGSGPAYVRCPNEACGQVLTVTPKGSSTHAKATS